MKVWTHFYFVIFVLNPKLYLWQTWAERPALCPSDPRPKEQLTSKLWKLRPDKQMQVSDCAFGHTTSEMGPALTFRALFKTQRIRSSFFSIRRYFIRSISVSSFGVPRVFFGVLPQRNIQQRFRSTRSGICFHLRSSPANHHHWRHHLAGRTQHHRCSRIAC